MRAGAPGGELLENVERPTPLQPLPAEEPRLRREPGLRPSKL